MMNYNQGYPQAYPPQGYPGAMFPQQGYPQHPPNYQQNFAPFPYQQQGTPDPYCQRCHGSGVRVKKNGMTGRCKCVKNQWKRNNPNHSDSSSD